MTCTTDSHNEAKNDDAIWLSWPSRGTQDTHDHFGTRLELRTCPQCHSTLARVLDESPPQCTVRMSAADALGVGYSMRALVRNSGMPESTRRTYDRVAQALIDAASKAVR